MLYREKTDVTATLTSPALAHRQSRRSILNPAASIFRSKDRPIAYARSIEMGGSSLVLRDLDLQPDYRSGRDVLLDDFYVPCLQESVLYDRAVGFFSSTLFHVVALAYSNFVRRGGRLRLICSPALKPEDFDAMKEADEISRYVQSMIRAELQELLNRPEAIPATRLLATLIANDIAEVRIAFADNPSGIFHDKLGVFEDIDGRRVSFVGSANETWRAWGLNHESFEVFPQLAERVRAIPDPKSRRRLSAALA